ncbi:HTTM domain-containing protein [Polyangium jinanense]|uniref:HTTM domain-containing protein n=1 Tax=Polyangium jinanense TaxID=2829994 RepID=A0A9X3XA51_9BACT|nr:HTTM domain-containing protein [Polyangium jinanense]MDC3985425.1 HTTM domain-containing protein [Polyangium jinanense]
MTVTETSPRESLVERLFRPVDIASLAAFRILFGALMLMSIVRFWANGWIRDFYIAPPFHFHYFGFSWVSPWPSWGMYAHFVVLGLASALVMVGLFYRAAAAVLFVAFTYVELLEKATYLNHYYLISILSFLMIFLPLHRAASIDAWRNPALASRTAPAWALLLLRFQIGVVYVFAGIAKLGSDWLLRGEPLGIWLSAHTDIPLVGPLLAEHWVARAASFAGAAFDLTVVFFLLRDRTRRFAYAAVIGFHFITGMLFPIGVFPWIMSASALIFFPPSWPRPLLARLSRRFACSIPEDLTAPEPPRTLGAWQRMGLALLAVHAIVQIALPLRHFLYPGNTAWSEEGFRFAWRVMLVEKLGYVELRIHDHATGRTIRAEPSRWLTPLQTKMMAQSPDMILELAHHVADDYTRRGKHVAVYADAWVTMNGRPSRRIIDPSVDLTTVQDSLLPKPWILPLDDNAEASATASSQP